MIASIGDFRTSAIASYAVTCPIDTCGSRNVALLDAITMSASATKCSPPPAHDAVDRGDHRLPHRVVPRGEPELGSLRAARLLAQRVGVAAQLDDVEPGLERRARSRCSRSPGRRDRRRAPATPRSSSSSIVRVHRVADVGPVELAASRPRPAARRSASRSAHDLMLVELGVAARRGRCAAACRPRCAGSASTRWNATGTLYGARCSRHAARSSSSVTSRVADDERDRHLAEPVVGHADDAGVDRRRARAAAPPRRGRGRPCCRPG